MPAVQPQESDAGDKRSALVSIDKHMRLEVIPHHEARTLRRVAQFGDHE